MRTVSYEFYSETYKGTLDQATFERLMVPSSAFVDDLTMGRAASENLSADELLRVQLALCAVADAKAMEEEMGGVTQETNDGVSITYGAQYAAQGEKRIRDAAVVYLAQTNLLYRGVG